MSPPAYELAGTAAVVGCEFTFEALAAAHDSSEEALVPALDELWQRRIVRERGAAAYDFGHNKIRTVVYADLGAARRQLLHQRVTVALETVQASDLDAVSAQIAVHYQRAGLPHNPSEEC